MRAFSCAIDRSIQCHYDLALFVEVAQVFPIDKRFDAIGVPSHPGGSQEALLGAVFGLLRRRAAKTNGRFGHFRERRRFVHFRRREVAPECW